MRILIFLALVLMVPTAPKIAAQDQSMVNALNGQLCRLRYIQRVQQGQIWTLNEIVTKQVSGDQAKYLVERETGRAEEKMDNIDATCGE